MKKTLRYSFIKALIKNGTETFHFAEAHHWLKLMKGAEKAYGSQVYISIINPLIEEGFIVKTDHGKYQLLKQSEAALEGLLHKRPGRRPSINEEGRLLVPAIIPPSDPDAIDTSFLEDIPPDPDTEEWERHIAQQMKQKRRP